MNIKPAAQQEFDSPGATTSNGYPMTILVQAALQQIGNTSTILNDKHILA